MLDDGTIVIAVRPNEAEIVNYSIGAKKGAKGMTFKIEIRVLDAYAAARFIEDLEAAPIAKRGAR